MLLALLLLFVVLYSTSLHPLIVATIASYCALLLFLPTVSTFGMLFCFDLMQLSLFQMLLLLLLLMLNSIFSPLVLERGHPVFSTGVVYSYDYSFDSESDSINLLQLITEEDKQKKKKLLTPLLLATIPLAADGCAYLHHFVRGLTGHSMLPC